MKLNAIPVVHSEHSWAKYNSLELYQFQLLVGFWGHTKLEGQSMQVLIFNYLT